MGSSNYNPYRDGRGRFAPGGAQPPTAATLPPAPPPTEPINEAATAGEVYERFRRLSGQHDTPDTPAAPQPDREPNREPSMLRGSEEWEQFNQQILRNPDIPASELKAQFIAVAAHRDQTDQVGDDYIGHVAGVARLTQETDQYRELTAEQQHTARQAAWLHDTLEDTAIRIEDLHAAGFDDEVVRVVEAVTARKGEAKQSYYKRILSAGRVAVAVKLGDLAHNNLPERRENLPGSPSNPVAPEHVGDPAVDKFHKLKAKYYQAYLALGATPPPHLMPDNT